jgi:hypothetical protein
LMMMLLQTPHRSRFISFEFLDSWWLSAALGVLTSSKIFWTDPSNARHAGLCWLPLLILTFSVPDFVFLMDLNFSLPLYVRLFDVVVLFIRSVVGFCSFTLHVFIHLVLYFPPFSHPVSECLRAS